MLASMSAAFADILAGRASVIDGDTLENHGTRVRPWGIDAPESDQLCGSTAASTIGAGRRPRTTLMPSNMHRPAECVEVDLDQYMAPDWPQYSKGA
jgi:hypothetical protein